MMDQEKKAQRKLGRFSEALALKASARLYLPSRTFVAICVYRSRYDFSQVRYIVSMKPKITTGTSAKVTTRGSCVTPARLRNALVRVRHQVLQEALLVARRLIMPCSKVMCAVTAGVAAGGGLGGGRFGQWRARLLVGFTR